MKYLVGLINNNLRTATYIKTRFLLVDTDKNTINDVTEVLCEGVTGADICNYKYDKGLAVYSFGCGLSHYLNDLNLNEVKTLDLTDCKLEMFNKSDVKAILKAKSVFEEGLKEEVLRFFKRKADFTNETI